MENWYVDLASHVYDTKTGSNVAKLFQSDETSSWFGVVADTNGEMRTPPYMISTAAAEVAWSLWNKYVRPTLNDASKEA